MTCKDCKKYYPLKRNWGKNHGYGKCLIFGNRNRIVNDNTEVCQAYNEGYITFEMMQENLPTSDTLTQNP